MTNSIPTASSLHDSTLQVADLPERVQEELATILDEYLVRLEQGTPTSPTALFKKYPEYASYLQSYLSGLRLFHREAVGPEAVKTLPMSSLGGDLNSQHRIGDFEITREVGRGGMGIVYEAQQLSLRRRVALKVLPFSPIHDEMKIARFKNEAQAAAHIRHPNIVPVYAIGEEEGVHFYSMQLVEGQSLTSLLTQLQTSATLADQSGNSPSRPHSSSQCPTQAGSRRDSTLGHVRAVARLGIQASEALHAAHEFGIVHRDIKPSNLLVDDEGKLWVTDFGLARCRETTGLTQTGDVVGTMRYMSPEQALGRSELVDYRTDIYSLGVTLYELATLNHPAGKKTDLEIMADRLRTPHKKLRAWNRHIPVDFETIIMKAMAELPADRYATARQLAEDLSRFVEGKPILASPPSVLNHAVKWARRHRRLVQSAACIAVLAFVAQSYNAWLLARSNQEKDAALASAQENLQEAHAVLDRASELGDQLAAVPGTEGVRYMLLEDSLKHYQRIADKAAHDRRLATDLALATSKLGSIKGKLGQKKESLQHHRAARSLWLARREAEPEESEHVRNLALTDNNIAMLLGDMGETGEADELLSEAEQLLRQLLADKPEHTQVSLDLATTTNNRGDLLRQVGDQEKAVAKFREAIATYESLIACKFENLAVLRGLAASYNNLGSMIKKSAGEEAVSVYKRAIEIQQQLVRSSAGDRSIQRELALTYNNLGYVLVSQQRWEQAMLSYENAVALEERLVKASPLVAVYRRELAVSYNNLAMMQTRSEHYADAEKSFKRAIQLQRLLLEATPIDAKILSNLGGVYNNLGLLCDQQLRSGEAEAFYKRAIQFQRRALDVAPQSTAYKQLLQNHYANYVKGLRRQDKHVAAEAVTRENHELFTHHNGKLGQE